jgi:hypothetical protein
LKESQTESGTAPRRHSLVFWWIWAALAFGLLAFGATGGVARRFMLRRNGPDQREIHVVNHGLIGFRIVTPTRRAGTPECATYKMHAEYISKVIESLDEGDWVVEILEGQRRRARILDLWSLGWAVIAMTIAGLAISAWARRKRAAWLVLLVTYALFAFGLLAVRRTIEYAFVDPVYEFHGPPDYLIRWHPAALIWIAWTVAACATLALLSRRSGAAPQR